MKTLFTIVAAMIVLITACKKEDANPGTPPVAPPVPVDFSVPADSVKLDPYGFAPLSALVSFSSPVAGRTVLIVKGRHGIETDIQHVFSDTGIRHSIPVIGLYSDYLNTVDIRLINTNGDTVAKTTFTIQTGGLPPDLPTSIVADIAPSGHEEPGINLVSNYSAGEPHIPLMVDNFGDIRWLLNYKADPLLNKLNYQDGIKRLRNGNFYFADYISDKVYEVDLLGKVLNSWDLKSAGYVFHHDIEEKPNGNFLLSVTKKGSTHTNGASTIEDYILELGRQDGSIINVWDLKESLDEYRTALTDDPEDWIHINSVLYDSSDNTIVISGRTQGVFKLTYDNKVKWIIGAHRGWGTNRRGEDLNQFLLTPLAADGSRITDTAVLNGTVDHPDFEWCWYQHSAIPLPNGDLMFFDNGNIRNYNFAAPKYSRAVEFAIDPVAMTIRQKWQYGKERGLETYSSIISSVQYLPKTNHVLFCPGYMVQNVGGSGGKIVEVDYASKQVILQLSINTAIGWAFHRAKRISAYPE